MKYARSSHSNELQNNFAEMPAVKRRKILIDEACQRSAAPHSVNQALHQTDYGRHLKAKYGRSHNQDARTELLCVLLGKQLAFSIAIDRIRQIDRKSTRLNSSHVS